VPDSGEEFSHNTPGMDGPTHGKVTEFRPGGG
jgi:hypothetical protein